MKDSPQAPALIEISDPAAISTLSSSVMTPTAPLPDPLASSADPQSGLSLSAADVEQEGAAVASPAMAASIDLDSH